MAAMTPQQHAKVAELRSQLCDAKRDISSIDPATHVAAKVAEAALKSFERQLADERPPVRPLVESCPVTGPGQKADDD